MAEQLQIAVHKFLMRFSESYDGSQRLHETTHAIPFKVALAIKNSMIKRGFPQFKHSKELSVATLLDPRFKVFGFGDCEPGSASHAAAESARKLLYKLVSDLTPSTPEKQVTQCPEFSHYFSLENRKARAHSRLAPLLDGKIEVDR